MPVLNGDVHLGAYLYGNENHSRFCSRTKTFFRRALIVTGTRRERIASHQPWMWCELFWHQFTLHLPAPVSLQNLKLTQASSSRGFDLLRRRVPLGVQPRENIRFIFQVSSSGLPSEEAWIINVCGQDSCTGQGDFQTPGLSERFSEGALNVCFIKRNVSFLFHFKNV